MPDSAVQEAIKVLTPITEITSRKIVRKMATIIASWRLLSKLTMRREPCTLTANLFKLIILLQSTFRIIWMPTRTDSLGNSSLPITLLAVASMCTKLQTQIP
jgi:hypothetical protein